MIDSLRELLSLDRGGKTLAQDERGIATWIVAGIAAILGVGALSTAAAINWEFLVAAMVLAVIGITAVGAVFFNVDFIYVIIIAIISLGIVVFLQIGTLAAVGLLVVGGTFYRFNPAGGRQLWMFILLIAIGIVSVVIGTQMFIVPELGIQPDAPLGFYP